MDLLQEQLRLEQDMFGSGIERFYKNNERSLKTGEASETAWYKRLAKEFVTPFSEGIKLYLGHYTTGFSKHGKAHRFLECLPTEVTAYVAIKIIFDEIGGKKPTSIQNLAERLGKRIEDQVRFTKVENAAPKYIEAIKESLKRSRTQSYKHKKDVMVYAERKLKENSNPDFIVNLDEWINWTKIEYVHLGMRLIDIFTETVRYKDEPVVNRSLVKHGSKRGGLYVLEPSSALLNWIEDYKEVVSELSPCYSPCVIKPLPWTTPFDGGFHSDEVGSKSKIAKVRDVKHLKRLTFEQMPKVYKAVNTLQSTAWTVNKRVLEVAEEIVDRDLQMASPSRERAELRKSPVPAEFSELSGAELKAAMTEEQYEEFILWKRESTEAMTAEAKRCSKYLSHIRSIAQARKYAQYEKFYFVYTLDFRSRIYCQSSLITPQGVDIQKGLINFHEGKKLGENGAYWLAVQGANVFGEDKINFDDRVKFIADMEEDIRDIAADPITFKMWCGVDKPWQFLNWCFEWNDYLVWCDEGKNPQDFVSRIPVAMDGSCSGIQHYSAMLRDPIGGKAVNLVPDKLPNDIYLEVALVAMDKLKEIAADPSRDPQEVEAAEHWLELFITRNLTKKSVMTLPYGSTRMTCADSVADYLKKIEGEEFKLAKSQGRVANQVHRFTQPKGEPMSRSLGIVIATEAIWTSIDKVVVAARVGMKFIKGVTKAVSAANSPLCWETPTGFIVKQAIFKVESKRVKTQLMGRTVVTLLMENETIDGKKMANSCAPNYIHSFDASHLMLAVNSMADKGINDIAVIHDSFGTYAGDTEKLRRSLLDSFVDMYQRRDWLEMLKEYNEDAILEEIDVDVPQPLGLDLEETRNSLYCFG